MVYTIDDIIREARKYSGIKDEKRFRKAYQFAKKAHKGQKRKSGEDYITHPLGVAYMLTKYKADEDALIAALLHDVVEDTSYDLTEINRRFGKSVATMVDGLTKLPRMRNINGDGSTHSAPDAEEYRKLTIESLRKMLEVMQKDVRVVVIKLVDRLHNMQTIDLFRREKQKRIAQETLDIYVRIAERLCIHEIREELEEACYKILYPDRYEELHEIRFMDSSEVAAVKEDILSNLKDTTISSHITELIVRELRDYEALFISLLNHKKSVEILLVMDTEENCYLALHVLHSLWRRKKGSFSDYLNTPKANGYRALVTNVLRDDGILLKFNIRTATMHKYNRVGVITTCFEGKEHKAHLEWVARLKRLDNETKEKSEEFRSLLDEEILQELMLVHGPHDTVLRLPHNSTALDAAFHLYGQKAFRLVEVLVNEKVVPFSYPMKQEDVFEGVLGDTDVVSHEWLQNVDTGLGRSYVFDYFKKLPDEELYRVGHLMVDEALQEQGMGYSQEIHEDSVSKKLREHGIDSVSDLYLLVGRGKIKPIEASSYFVNQHLHKKDITEKYFTVNITIVAPHSRQIDIVHSLTDKIAMNVTDIKHLKTSYSHGIASLSSVMRLTPAQYSHLNKLIGRMSEVIKFSVRSKAAQFSLGILSSFLIVLWGLDPVLAAFILRSTPVDAISFVTLRFASLTFFCGLILIFSGFFNSHSRLKSFSIWKKDFWMSLFSLFSTALFAYLSLQQGLDPLEYIFLSYIVVYLLSIGKEKNKNILALFLLALFISAALVYGADLSPKAPLAYFFGAISAVGFSTYTFFSSSFQQQQRIKVRHFLFLFKIFALSSLLSILLLLFFPWPTLGIWMYFLVFVFSLLFNFVPYVLYSLLMSRFGYSSFVWHRLSFVLPVVFLAEIVVLGIELSYSKLAAMFLIAIISFSIINRESHNYSQLFSENT